MARTNHRTTSARFVTARFASREAVWRLDQAARKLGISRSDLVRIAVDERVAAILDGPPPEELAAFTAARAERAALASVGTETRCSTTIAQ